MSATSPSVDEIDLADERSFQLLLDFLVSIRIFRIIFFEKNNISIRRSIHHDHLVYSNFSNTYKKILLSKNIFGLIDYLLTTEKISNAYCLLVRRQVFNVIMNY